jgi:hypothetical protein
MADQCASAPDGKHQGGKFRPHYGTCKKTDRSKPVVNPKRWFERNHPGRTVIAVAAERPLADRQVQRGASLTQDHAKQSNMSKAIFR